MKDGVRIINCARGGLVVEEELAAAIKSGKVAGAGVDVFVTEPAESSPLFGLPNVVCTPHLGASTTEAQENVAIQVAEQMADYLVDGAVSNALNMPSISAEEAPRLTPVRPARRAARLVRRPAHRDDDQGAVAIEYAGDVADMNTKALTAALIAGLLRPILSEVNMVNAPVVARERGIAVDEVRQSQRGAYETYIRLTVRTERQERSVAGTVFSDGRPRIIQIKGIDMEAGFAPPHALRHQPGQARLHRPPRHAARQREGQHRQFQPRPRGRRRGRHLADRGRRADRRYRAGAGVRRSKAWSRPSASASESARGGKPL